MEATSAPPILLPGIDHPPCLQEIRSVKDKPFYCQSSVGAIPFQAHVFLLLVFCKQYFVTVLVDVVVVALVVVVVMEWEIGMWDL